MRKYLHGRPKTSHAYIRQLKIHLNHVNSLPHTSPLPSANLEKAKSNSSTRQGHAFTPRHWLIPSIECPISVQSAYSSALMGPDSVRTLCHCDGL